MKKEYTKPIAEVMTFCNSENILSASGPEPVIIEVGGNEEENPSWGDIKGGDWEVD